ncbi:hypothetical protein NDU88_004113 [Pleurodeles waltl]|uniref:Uncharacterized protein n=1 Tax=Pleurodeles waltl TaxID=8319 RepID=A0AAV7UF66_PLEWA|nr:hypothetical protein NDU88_004113 [Pleurodeles waltl]
MPHEKNNASPRKDSNYRAEILKCCQGAMGRLRGGCTQEQKAVDRNRDWSAGVLEAWGGDKQRIARKKNREEHPCLAILHLQPGRWCQGAGDGLLGGNMTRVWAFLKHLWPALRCS